MSGSRSDIDLPATGLLPPTEAVESGTPTDAERYAESPRGQMMARIAEKYNQQREQELQAGEEMHAEARSLGLTFDSYEEPPADEGVTETSNRPAPTVGSPRRAPPEAPAPAAPAAQQPVRPQVAAPSDELFEVEVDGQRFNVNRDQMTHLARMGMIANKTVSDWQRQQQWQQYQPAPVERVPEPPPPAQTLSKERLRETVKKLQYSTEDDAAEALGGLIQEVVQTNRPPPPPQFNQRQIVDEATMQAMRAWENQQNAAIIRQEYGDILSDPMLSDTAGRQVEVLRRELAMLGRSASELDILREAGNRVRARFNMQPRSETPSPGDIGGSPAPQSDTIRVRPRPNVDARKREAPRTTSASNLDVRSPAPAPERQPNGSDIVEWHRQKRGQSTMR